MFRVRVEDATSGAAIEEPVGFDDELFAHRKLESVLAASQADGAERVRVIISDPSGVEIFSLTTEEWMAGSYLFEDGLYADRT